MLPLTELAKAAGFSTSVAEVMVSGITSDSRQVAPGSLFAALKGTHADGTRFIAQAQQAGAVAVLCDEGTPDVLGMVMLRTANPRLALAKMAARFYGAQPAHVVAVTGTDGKTSTCDFFRQFMHHLGSKVASIGTLGILGGDGAALYPGSHTTPDPVQLHKLLAELAGQGVDYAAMEASSHGLDQYRLDGVRLEAAAFTNFGRDHLDYHVTPEAYFAAKARLFDALLPEGATAVLNQDDARFVELRSMAERRQQRVIGFGVGGEQFRLLKLEPRPHGQLAALELFGQRYELEIPLVGAFQAMNILAALGLVVGSGGELEAALGAIAKLKGVPGRLEQVARLGNGATVFIDYAHTPLALGNILRTLRPHTAGQLHVVFGCGGDRDAGKRPEMGRIACELADRVVVTDDNPRSEEPGLIRRAILAACKDAKEVADRRDAIYGALRALGPGDILVIAGKGHEKTQIIGERVLPFDDADVAREGARELNLTA